MLFEIPSNCTEESCPLLKEWFNAKGLSEDAGTF